MSDIAGNTVQSMNFRVVVLSGFRVELWNAICQDCGFVSGMAAIPGHWTISGAGCRTRRGPREAEAMAAAKAEALAVVPPC